MSNPIIADQQSRSWQQLIHDFRVEHLPTLKIQVLLMIFHSWDCKMRFLVMKSGVLGNCPILGGMPSI